MSRLRGVSLFSNCGAGDLGYRKAGFEFDVMAELDPRRLDVCLLNHPGAVGVPGDLRETWPLVIKQYRARAGVRRPALLCACPPCQGMSSARTGMGAHSDAEAGSRDQRNLLVTVIVKVALELMPSLIVVENVTAFLSRMVLHPVDKKPISAADFLIQSLATDYVAYPLLADLADFGVPQSRQRAFITFVRKDVAGLSKLKKSGRAPYPRANFSAQTGYHAPVTLSDALAAFALPDLDAASAKAANADGFGGLHAVPVWNEKIYGMVSAIPSGSGRSAWENGSCNACGSENVAAQHAVCPNCGSHLPRPIVQDTDGSYRLVRGFKSSYRRMRPDRPAATITTASGHVGSDNTIHPSQNRLLSPLECSLLQTFPRDFKWGETLRKYGHTTVREMIGEAVPPAFTRLHGEVLRGILRREWTRAPISIFDDRCLKAVARIEASSRAAKKVAIVQSRSLGVVSRPVRAKA